MGETRSWQDELLERLRHQLGTHAVEPYGSVVTGDADVWSDLDVRVHADAVPPVEALLAVPLWAWQESVTDAGQVIRLVTEDGRRVDASFTDGRTALPVPPTDNAIRFDAALAATRIGRGAHLIGLHLLLGISRETLVQGMLLADRDTGTDHHRHGTARDRLAHKVAALLAEPLVPATALRVYELYSRTRRQLGRGHRGDASGLAMLLARAAGQEAPLT